MVDFRPLLFAKRKILLRRLIKIIAEYFFELSVLLENQEVCLYSEKIIQKQEFISEAVEQKIFDSVNAAEVFDITLKF